MKAFCRVTGFLSLLLATANVLWCGGNIFSWPIDEPVTSLILLAGPVASPAVAGVLLLRWRGQPTRARTQLLAGLVAIYPAITSLFIITYVIIDFGMFTEGIGAWGWLLFVGPPTAVSVMTALALVHVALQFQPRPRTGQTGEVVP